MFPDLRFPTCFVHLLQADVVRHLSGRADCVHGRTFAVPDQAEVFGLLLHIDNRQQCHRWHRSRINNRQWRPSQTHLCNRARAWLRAI